MKLGETRVEVRLYGPKGHVDVEMLVDTGATISKVPESIAIRLGLAADEVVTVRLADGRLKERGLSEAKIEYASARRTISILIGADGEEPLLGLTALETLLLKVNPVTRKLEPATPIEYVIAAT